MFADRRAIRAPLLALLALVFLLGASPCSPDYIASRQCTNLSMQVTIGSPGVLVPDCLGTSPMQFTLVEVINFPSTSFVLSTAIVGQRFGNEVQITPNIAAVPGIATVVVSTRRSTYTVTVQINGPNPGPPPTSGDRCPLMPQPAPGSLMVTPSAVPPVVSGAGTSQLSEVVTHGVGPFTYAWRSYAGRGVLSGSLSATLASPVVGSLVPDEDSFFFVDVTDNGVPGNNPNHVSTGCVRVHASEGPVARFTATPHIFSAGTSDVTLNPSGSTDITSPVFWSVEYFADVQPAPVFLEDYLRLGDVGWTLVTDQDSDFGTVIPASVFAQAGVYRVKLKVFDNLNSHSTYEFLQVLPPVQADAGTPDAGTPDAGTPDAGTPDAGLPDAGSVDAGQPSFPPIVTVALGSGDVVPSNGTIELSCSADHGVGPFTFAWHGYRDEGAPGPGPFQLSANSGAQVLATFFFPTADFYFFCVATDNGVPAGDPNRTTSVYVLVHESDGPVGRFTIAPGPFHFGVDDVTADAGASTGMVAPISWSLEQYVGTDTPSPGIEGYLQLFSSQSIVWVELYAVDTTRLAVTIPAATFPAAGIYRLRLDVFNSDFDPHTSYQYFTVLP